MRNAFNIEYLPEFDGHRSVYFLYDQETRLRAFIAIHRGGLNDPAFGASRYWKYDKEIDALRDALRLSRIMSYKSAISGLPYGGAKGVIMSNEVINKELVLKAYANRLKYLSGRFITGTDVGLDRKDLLTLAKYGNNFVGLKNNPEKATVDGFFEALKVTLEEICGEVKLREKSFIIQGLGKTGWEIMKRLYEFKSEKIIATDIDSSRMDYASRFFPGVCFVRPSEIYKQKADIFVPCALSGILNRSSILSLKVKMIVGVANNQLVSEDLGYLLMSRGIFYAPDYVVNSGGLISVAGEYKLEDGLNIKKRIKRIGFNLRQIIRTSKIEKIPTNVVANRMAESYFNKII